MEAHAPLRSATIISVTNLKRREFLRSLGAAATTLSFSRAAFSQAGPMASKLTDTITLISGAGNNIVAVKGDSGSLLVDCGDCGAHPGHPEAHRQRHEGVQYALAPGIDGRQRRDGEGRGEACFACEHATLDDPGNRPRLGKVGDEDLSRARQGSSANGNVLHNRQDHIRRGAGGIRA